MKYIVVPKQLTTVRENLVAAEAIPYFCPGYGIGKLHLNTLNRTHYYGNS